MIWQIHKEQKKRFNESKYNVFNLGRQCFSLKLRWPKAYSFIVFQVFKSKIS